MARLSRIVVSGYPRYVSRVTFAGWVPMVVGGRVIEFEIVEKVSSRDLRRDARKSSQEPIANIHGIAGFELTRTLICEIA